MSKARQNIKINVKQSFSTIQKQRLCRKMSKGGKSMQKKIIELCRTQCKRNTSYIKYIVQTHKICSRANEEARN